MSKFRGFYIVLIFSLLIVGLGTTSNLIGNTPNINPNTLNSGSIEGIDYAYGNQTFFASGNFTQTANGTIIEVSNYTRSQTISLPLFTSYNIFDALFRLDTWETDPVANITSFSENYMFNDTFQAEIDFLTNTSRVDGMPSMFNATDPVDGFNQMNLTVTEDIRSADVVVITRNDKFLGQFPMGVTLLEFNYKHSPTNITRRTIEIVTIVMVVEVTIQLFDVMATQTVFSSAYMGYATTYSNAYNVSANAYQVSITDGINLAVEVSMFDKIQANYTETVVSYLGYAFHAFEYTELNFTNPSDFAAFGVNGTAMVPWDMFPRDLLPKSYQAEGLKIEAGYRQVQSTLLSTFQSVTAAFATVSADFSGDQAQLEANLAIWGVQSATVLAAYRDGNNNSKFDLAVDSSGLKVDSSDRLEYLGLTEAYQTTVVNAYFNSHVYNESVQLFGLGVNITNTNVNDTVFRFDVESFGYGNISQDANTQFFFNTPTTDIEGNVVFDFGIDYYNFPVTWINMTNPADSFEENQHIGYHYIVKVNPVTGQVKISPTWYYGGMSATNIDAMTGLSLSWIVKSEFFALKAVYTATATDKPLNSSSTSEISRLRVGVGTGSSTEIDVTGPKEIYWLNNGSQSHKASFDAIKLIEVSGSFEGERVTPFDSESSNTGGTATVGALVETLSVDFFYTASLIIISYPVWDGGDIVHDPDYNVAYQPKEQVVDPTTPPTMDTTTPPTTTVTDTTGSTTPPVTDGATTTTAVDDKTTVSPDKSEASGLPGFGFFLVLSTLIIIKRKTSKKE